MVLLNLTYDCTNLYPCCSLLGNSTENRRIGYKGIQRLIFTARIRRLTEGNVFTLSTIAGGGGTTIWLTRGGYPLPRGLLPSQTGGVGVLPSQVGSTPYRNSIACTCYAAGGVPLAFTQDFPDFNNFVYNDPISPSDPFQFVKWDFSIPSHCTLVLQNQKLDTLLPACNRCRWCHNWELRPHRC